MIAKLEWAQSHEQQNIESTTKVFLTLTQIHILFLTHNGNSSNSIDFSLLEWLNPNSMLSPYQVP